MAQQNGLPSSASFSGPGLGGGVSQPKKVDEKQFLSSPASSQASSEPVASDFHTSGQSHPRSRANSAGATLPHSQSMLPQKHARTNSQPGVMPSASFYGGIAPGSFAMGAIGCGNEYEKRKTAKVRQITHKLRQMQDALPDANKYRKYLRPWLEFYNRIISGSGALGHSLMPGSEEGIEVGATPLPYEAEWNDPNALIKLIFVIANSVEQASKGSIMDDAVGMGLARDLRALALAEMEGVSEILKYGAQLQVDLDAQKVQKKEGKHDSGLGLQAGMWRKTPEVKEDIPKVLKRKPEEDFARLRKGMLDERVFLMAVISDILGDPSGETLAGIAVKLSPDDPLAACFKEYLAYRAQRDTPQPHQLAKLRTLLLQLLIDLPTGRITPANAVARISEVARLLQPTRAQEPVSVLGKYMQEFAACVEGMFDRKLLDSAKPDFFPLVPEKSQALIPHHKSYVDAMTIWVHMTKKGGGFVKSADLDSDPTKDPLFMAAHEVHNFCLSLLGKKPVFLPVKSNPGFSMNGIG